MKKVTIADIEVFDTERFNDHYRNLIDIGLTSSREEDAINTLSFINDFQILIEDLKKDYAAEPDECQNHTEKEKKLINENLNLHREIDELKKENKFLQKENDLQHKLLFSKNEKLTVCK